jgi:hypothetical protein
MDFALLLIKKRIKRAFEFGEALRYEVKVDYGGFYGGMTKESFNRINVRCLIEQVGCKTMAQGVDAVAFV